MNSVIFFYLDIDLINITDDSIYRFGVDRKNLDVFFELNNLKEDIWSYSGHIYYLYSRIEYKISKGEIKIWVQK